MSTTRYASVLGLGFGDCGKGHFVDALTRRWQAHTVVRFNGGAQAGHNVVTPADASSAARHHTFSQFGAGTLVPGVRTLLLDPMIVHPTALLVEAEVLGRIGIHDALSRLKIDAQCRITTPYHQAAGRLRELLRGGAAHGTCGVGVGETVRHALEHPGQELRYGDLSQTSAGNARMQLDRLQAIRETLLAEFLPQCPKGSAGALSAEFQTLHDETLAAKWMTSTRALARHCPPGSADAIHDQLKQPGCVLFEGAQGVLLDEWRGFHPHTTWSSINTAAVNGVAARFGISASIKHYGVIRTYLTRHGAGPLPTHDESLDGLLPEPHNHSDGWQGNFRRGHPDAVLLRYALEAAGDLSGLLISHLDVFQRDVSLKWCERYSAGPPLPQAPQFIERLPLSSGENLAHQLMLTNLLQSARPQYDSDPIRSAPAFIDRIAGVTSLPVILRSYGKTLEDQGGGRLPFHHERKVFIGTPMKLPSDYAGSNHRINNLFLALIPEGHAGPQVNELAQQEKTEHHFIGEPLGLQQYHLSLFSFGKFPDIPSDLVSSIGKIFEPLAAATEPFPVYFDRARTVDTRKPKLPFVLYSSQINKTLMEFYRKLSPRGRGNRKTFKPHVTLLYDAKNIPEHPVHPVGWTVSELVLVRSYVGLGRHEHLARWPLLGKPPKSVQMDLTF